MSKVFSPSRLLFYPPEYESLYRAAGTWPDDGVGVSDETWVEFTSGHPDGKILGVVNGQPAWVDPPPPAPLTVAQQARAMLAAGCQITCISDPSINGTFAVDAEAQNKIMATALFLQVNGRFPGSMSLLWPAADGTQRVFHQPAQFVAFATAVGDFVARLDHVIAGFIEDLPPQPAAIP